MSFSEEQLKEHCQDILNDRSIKSKIVILCEGEASLKEKRSPQSYRQRKQMPDANFYKACIPRWWSQYKPEFIDCGDRQDVLNTFFTLLELHDENQANSYLSPEKLFALVDLDIQVKKIENYSFSNTEEIFFDLYEQAKIKEANIPNHRILITGLVHKESYFIIPDLQSIFDEFPTTLRYNNDLVILEKIYFDMADHLSSDSDLKDKFQQAINRISYCLNLNCSAINDLQTSWKDEFQLAVDDTRKHELIFALLVLRKAKDYWKQIFPCPSSEWISSGQVFREQLSLEIGRFYSDNSDNPKYHIPFLLAKLHHQFYGNNDCS